MSALELLELTDPRWARFVSASGGSTPFHQPGWAQFLAECYRFPAHAAVVSDDTGKISAGLPMLEVGHWARRRWVALPFTDYCPPLAASPHARDELVRAIEAAVAERGLRRAEIRGGVPNSTVVGFRHVLPLGNDPAQVWNRLHRSQVQRNIKRAEREGVTIRAATTEDELTDVFYRLHLATRRRHGVPVQSRPFFRLLWRRQVAEGHGSLLLAEHGGVPIAAGLFLHSFGATVYKFGASEPSSWRLRPNHLLMWRAVEDACARGDDYLDFGRTDLDNSGLRDFKRRWGTDEEPLRYSWLGADTAAVKVPGHAGAAASILATAIRSGPSWVCRAAGGALYRYAA